jgi:hypothetical protein
VVNRNEPKLERGDTIRNLISAGSWLCLPNAVANANYNIAKSVQVSFKFVILYSYTDSDRAFQIVLDLDPEAQNFTFCRRNTGIQKIFFDFGRISNNP